MIRIVILAAGKGTRMNSNLPKVLINLRERPIISYLMDSVIKSEVDPKPIIVVSPDNLEIISQTLNKYQVEYVVQKKTIRNGQCGFLYPRSN